MIVKNGTMLVSENKRYLIKDIVSTKKERYVLMVHDEGEIKLAKGDYLNVTWEFKIRTENG